MLDDPLHSSAVTPQLPDGSHALHLPLGSRVIVMSDLFLTPTATEASASASREVARALGGFEGPGAAVFAGNLFDLVGDNPADPGAAIAVHGELKTAMERFLAEQPSRHVIVLAGTRDRSMLFDAEVGAVVRGLGATIALSVDVNLETVGGTRTVRVDPGWRWDERNAFDDPRNPADTPLGHHVVAEVFPRIRSARTTWLAGIDRLTDQTSIPRFVASRFIYRRIARFLWWLLIPVVVALVTRISFLSTSRGHTHAVTSTLLVAAGTLAGEIILVGATLVYLNSRVCGALWASPCSGSPA